MRVTLTIDDDVYATAKEIAQQERATLGQVMTQMMCVGMQDERRRRPELMPSSAPTPLEVSNDLGKRIQARFLNQGELPNTPRYQMRVSPFLQDKPAT